MGPILAPSLPVSVRSSPNRRAMCSLWLRRDRSLLRHFSPVLPHFSAEKGLILPKTPPRASPSLLDDLGRLSRRPCTPSEPRHCLSLPHRGPGAAAPVILSFGREDPRSLDPIWSSTPTPIQLVDDLERLNR